MMILLFNVLLGLCLGSFFHVMVMRMEEGKSFVKGRSRCDRCGKRLLWYELIPIMSYILLLGKCRYCKSEISKDHFISELLIGGGFGITGYCLTTMSVAEVAIMYITICVIGISAISDLKTQNVYPAIIYAGCLLVAGVRAYELVMNGNPQRLIGVCVVSVLLVVFFFCFGLLVRKYIGGGDFDVAFLLFLSCGGYGLLRCLFYGSFIGLIFLMPAFMIRSAALKTSIPLVPLLYLGYIINLIL